MTSRVSKSVFPFGRLGQGRGRRECGRLRVITNVRHRFVSSRGGNCSTDVRNHETSKTAAHGFHFVPRKSSGRQRRARSVVVLQKRIFHFHLFPPSINGVCHCGSVHRVTDSCPQSTPIHHQDQATMSPYQHMYRNSWDQHMWTQCSHFCTFFPTLFNIHAHFHQEKLFFPFIF